jgi:cGMP-dependent protein kinase
MRDGVFGQVLLVQHITEKGLYILKAYSKQKIEEHFVERYFIQEKNLLKSMNFPFVMELYKTFKDCEYLYSLVEFVRGEELYDVIREIGLLSTEDCQFYIGCMVLLL